MYHLSKTVTDYIRKVKVSSHEIKRLSISMNVLLLIMVASLFMKPDKETEQVNPSVTALMEKVCEYECKLDSFAHAEKRPSKISKRATKVEHKRKIVRSSLFLDNFRIASSVDRYLSQGLHKALDEYSGPGEPLITSMRRAHCKSSKHAHGKAIDVNMDRHGQEMLKWLRTTEGKEWLTKYNIAFVLEDKPNSKRLQPYLSDSTYQQVILKNRHATGLHLHIYASN